MTSTVGIDLIYLPSFVQSLRLGGQELRDRLFTSSEQHNTEIESLAGISAVKEAVFKALNEEKMLMTELEVQKTSTGQPVVHFSHKRNISFCDVSLSHDGEYVTAICIMEHR